MFCAIFHGLMFFYNWSIHGSRIYVLHFGSNDNDGDHNTNIIQAMSNSKDGSFHITMPNNNDKEVEQQFIANDSMTKEGLLNSISNQKGLLVTILCQDKLQSDNDATTHMFFFPSSASSGMCNNEEYL